MRRAATIVALAGLVAAGLAGCSSTASAANCGSAAAPGAASDTIHVAGPFGTSSPEVSFPTPLKTTTTQRTILTPGSGPLLQDGQTVVGEISIYNGATGQLMPPASYGAAPGPITFNIGGTLPGISNGLLCARDHSRVAIAVSPNDGTKDGATSLVVVVDVKKAYLPRANGTPDVHVPNTPRVFLAPNGAPGIVVPNVAPPKKLTVIPTKTGHGESVKKGDAVIVQFTGVVWNDDKNVFTSTWNGSGATAIVADSSSSGPLADGVTRGLAQALIGAKVGSQLQVTVPPRLGYGASGSAEAPKNATLVYVVDVLGIHHSS
ncbi:MAG TPA: FKBP-type peptidyl-prolyl cis-trans isomerase [Microbacteriaceae bacterium]|nr:FKBP-type peptidyl-prolyl cis-trans isomerase [Microbacteriaceae bacterium]